MKDGNKRLNVKWYLFKSKENDKEAAQQKLEKKSYAGV
jgi:hypothetical protein